MYDFQPVLQRGIKLAWGPSTKLVTGPSFPNTQKKSVTKFSVKYLLKVVMEWTLSSNDLIQNILPKKVTVENILKSLILYLVTVGIQVQT